MDEKNFSENVHSLLQQIVYARNITQSLRFELAQQVEEEEGYLFENAKDFSNLMLQIIEGLDLNLELEYQHELLKLIRLDDEKKINTDGEELRRLRQRITEAIQISSELTNILKYIHGAKAIENPWAIITEMDRLCRNLNVQARVIPYPKWEHNYRYYPISSVLWRISELANAQDSRINSAMTQLLADSPYYFSLQFPPTGKPNLLQMAMWGHELGHFIDNIEGMALFNIESPFDQVPYISQQRVNQTIRNTIPKKIIAELMENTLRSDEDKIYKVLETINEPMGKLIYRWAREIFADIYSVHLFGPAAVFSLVEFVQPLSSGKTKELDSSYPPFGERLELILQEYDTWLSSDPEVSKLIENSAENEILAMLNAEIQRLKILKDEFPVLEVPDSKLMNMDDDFNVVYPYMKEILRVVVSDFGAYIKRLKDENPDCYLKPSDLIKLRQSVSDLALGIPPNPIDTHDTSARARILPLVINSGWIYWLKLQISKVKNQLNDADDLFMQVEFERVNDTMLKAVQANVAIEWFAENSRFTETDSSSDEKMFSSIGNIGSQPEIERNMITGVLQKSDIVHELTNGNLTVRPLISPTTQISQASIDLRLGNEFLIMKRSALTKLDPTQMYKNPNSINHQSKHFVPFGKPFVLHPWQFISTICLEFIKIPEPYVGWVTNRKFWTKLGLIYVGMPDLPPNFAGNITLELTNFGNVPILLYPGARICSLYLFPLSQ